MTNKIVIIGGSSSLGKALFDYFSQKNDYEVKSTFFSQVLPNAIHLDLRSETKFSQLEFIDSQTTVLILSAIADPYTVFHSPEISREVNVLGIKRLIDFLKNRNSRIIFASSVEVLDGQSAPQSEQSPLKPLNLYGKMKAEIESYITQLFPIGEYSIVRTPWISHINNESRCVVRNTYEKMISNTIPGLAIDYFSSIVASSDVCKGYSKLTSMQYFPQIIHLAADGGFSRAELAQNIMQYSIFGNKMKFRKVFFDDLDLPEPRARDTRLTNELSRNLLDMSYVQWKNVIKSKVQFLDAYTLSNRVV